MVWFFFFYLYLSIWTNIIAHIVEILICKFFFVMPHRITFYGSSRFMSLSILDNSFCLETLRNVIGGNFPMLDFVRRICFRKKAYKKPFVVQHYSI
jgi:hypothetical protein